MLGFGDTMKRFSLMLVFMALVLVLIGCSGKKQPAETDTPVVPEVNENDTEIVEEVKEPVATLLNLYFPDDQALYLHNEQRVVGVTEDEQLEMVILEQLFKGPKNEGLSPSLEGENLINSVSTDEKGLCTVDFKGDFVLLNTGGTARESFVIGSIVNSLCSLENVNSVKINIDGNTNAEFGHSTLDSVFTAQDDLIFE